AARAHTSTTSASFSFTTPPSTEPSPLSLHDALPICAGSSPSVSSAPGSRSPSRHAIVRVDWPAEAVTSRNRTLRWIGKTPCWLRSEEHTSELQSRVDLVCRLLLEKKKEEKMGYCGSV